MNEILKATFIKILSVTMYFIFPLLHVKFNKTDIYNMSRRLTKYHAFATFQYKLNSMSSYEYIPGGHVEGQPDVEIRHGY